MGFRRRYDRGRRREPQQRVNNRIRVPEIRVIDANGDMLGVMQTQDALRRARDQGLDLVEINPKASPPVCKILDYGKYKYDEKKKKRETKRKQATVEIKEIKLRPKTDDHDLDFKARAARRFIETGNKVKFTVRFRGREITHPEKARDQLVWIEDQCKDIANTEGRPSMEGRTMTMIIAPKPTVLQALSASKAAAERERKAEADARKAEKNRRASAPGGSKPGKSDPGKSDPGKSDAGESSPGKERRSQKKARKSQKEDAKKAVKGRGRRRRRVGSRRVGRESRGSGAGTTSPPFSAFVSLDLIGELVELVEIVVFGDLLARFVLEVFLCGDVLFVDLIVGERPIAGRGRRAARRLGRVGRGNRLLVGRTARQRQTG